MCLISKWWSSVLDGHWLARVLEEQARSDWRETFQAAVAHATRQPNTLGKPPSGASKATMQPRGATTIMRPGRHPQSGH
jgi:hypothetical protein